MKAVQFTVVYLKKSIVNADDLPSFLPIPRPAALVGDGEHADKFDIYEEEQGVREALEAQARCPAQAGAAHAGLLRRKVGDAFQFLRECEAWSYAAVFPVPVGCFFSLRQRFGTE